MICTFFGHRDAPSKMEGAIRETIERLISEGVTCFYVGNNGNFDSMVHRQLKQLREKYPHIRYAVVLAYMPGEVSEYEDHSDTMLPEGIEEVHPRYAIDWRNRWMLDHADIVVTYITHSWGGAAQFAEKAQRQKKGIIPLV